jgi:site-specific recombinase XerD
MTLSTYMEHCLQWRAAKLGASPASVEQYRRAYRTFTAYLRSAGLPDAPKSFTREALAGWEAAERGHGVGPRTLASRLGMFTSLGDFLLEQRDGRGRPLLTENPARGYRRPKYRKAASHFLYAAELRAFLEVERPERESLARDVLLDTMLRVSELCEANVGDFVEPEPGRHYLTVQVKGQRALGAQKRYVPVSPPVAKALESYLLARGVFDPVKSANEPLLVNSRGKRWTRNAMTDLMARIGQQAGIGRFRVSAHKLRHTANVVARHGGVDAVVRSALLNHSSPRTVQEYDHVLPAEIYQARLQQREGLARYTAPPQPRQ